MWGSVSEEGRKKNGKSRGRWVNHRSSITQTCQISGDYCSWRRAKKALRLELELAGTGGMARIRIYILDLYACPAQWRRNSVVINKEENGVASESARWVYNRTLFIRFGHRFPNCSSKYIIRGVPYTKIYFSWLIKNQGCFQQIFRILRALITVASDFFFFTP